MRLLTALLGAAWGSIPGVFLYFNGFGETSFHIALLGVLVGFALGCGGLNIRRLFRLFFVVLIGKVVRSDRLYDWVDEAGESDQTHDENHEDDGEEESEDSIIL